MKKVTLIQCYSDHNYGDLGIILSTTELLFSISNDLEINGISTYNANDPRFLTEHEDLKKYLGNKKGKILPSIFGIVDRTKGNVYFNSFFNLLRFLLLIPFARQNWIAKLLLNKQEIESYKRIKSSDLIISKGGSFFCDNHGKLGFLSFFRLWYIALLAVKLKKKVIILGQSIGPLNSPVSKWYGNYLLKKIDKVILRESVCLSEYKYFVDRDYIINNDMVFYQKIVQPKLDSTLDLHSKRKVGVTIKYVDKDQGKYFVFVKSAIEIMVRQYNFDVVILPQVPLDSDINASKEVWNILHPDVQKNVAVLDDLNGIENLLQKYSELYFVLGTRLHSCIFSWSVGVPAINISYHGTKSQGIYDNLGLSNWVLDYSSEDSLDLFTKNIGLIIESRESIIKDVASRIKKDRVEVDMIINDLLSH